MDHKFESDGEVYEIQCTRSNPLSEDCQICNKIKQKAIRTWIKRHEKFCLLCSEQPKCYLCLRAGCSEWLKDKQFIEEYGTYRGCSRLMLNKYCEDFVCRHGFKGWWHDDWRERFKKVQVKAGKSIMKERKKIKKKEAKNEPKSKKTVEKKE